MKASALAAAFCALPGALLAEGENLDRYLNGASTNGDITFGFSRAACTGTATLTQVHDTSTRTTRAEFDFGDLALDEFGLSEYPSFGIAQLDLTMADSAPGLTSDVRLSSDDEATRAQWVETVGSGATCDGSECQTTLNERQLHLIVAGPQAGLRAELVLSDLRALAADCSN